MAASSHGDRGRGDLSNSDVSNIVYLKDINWCSVGVKFLMDLLMFQVGSKQ